MQPTAGELQHCSSRAHERMQDDILFSKLRCDYNFESRFCQLSFSLPSVFPNIRLL